MKYSVQFEYDLIEVEHFVLVFNINNTYDISIFTFFACSLAEILSADRKALNNDQILLNELQKEIDVIKPKHFFAPKETCNQIFMTADDICYNVPCNSNKTVYDTSEEYNERLQALKEERESLLRTGNYTADDVVIKKLNAEIRSLLVSR